MSIDILDSFLTQSTGSAAVYFKEGRSDTLTLANSTLMNNRNGSLYVDSAATINLLGNVFNSDKIELRETFKLDISGCQFKNTAALHVLNTDNTLFTSLVFDDNEVDRQAQIRSFPTTLKLSFLNSSSRDDTNGKQRVCPNCQVTLHVQGSTIFGDNYPFVPFANRDFALVLVLNIKTYDDDYQLLQDKVELEESEEIKLAPLESGSGSSTFKLPNLAKKAKHVEFKLDCAPSSVCIFNRSSLLDSVMIGGCPAGFRKDNKGEDRQCVEKKKTSPDKYSAMSETQALFLLIPVSLVLAVVVIEYFRTRKRIQKVLYRAPLTCLFQSIDFLTDVNMSQSLWQFYFSAGNSDWQWLALASGCTAFTVIPYALNLFLTKQLPALIKNNAPLNRHAEIYVRNHSNLIIATCLWTGSLTPAIELVNCRLWGWSKFTMGLTSFERSRFLKYKVRMTIWIENVPQLALQSLVLTKSLTEKTSEFSGVAVFSMVFSLISIFTALVMYSVQKQNRNLCRPQAFTVELSGSTTDGERTQSLSRKYQRLIRVNRHRFVSMERKLCSLFDVSKALVSVGYVEVREFGFKIYGNAILPYFGGEASELAHREQDYFQSIWSDVFRLPSRADGSLRFIYEREAALSPVAQMQLAAKLAKSIDIFLEHDDSENEYEG